MYRTDLFSLRRFAAVVNAGRSDERVLQPLASLSAASSGFRFAVAYAGNNKCLQSEHHGIGHSDTVEISTRNAPTPVWSGEQIVGSYRPSVGGLAGPNHVPSVYFR